MIWYCTILKLFHTHFLILTECSSSSGRLQSSLARRSSSQCTCIEGIHFAARCSFPRLPCLRFLITDEEGLGMRIKVVLCSKQDRSSVQLCYPALSLYLTSVGRRDCTVKILFVLFVLMFLHSVRSSATF